MYSIIFLWYFICRPLKAYSVSHKDFNLDKFRYISLILVTFVSLIFYLYITTVSNPKNVSDDISTTSGSTESSANSLSVTDGVYSATSFGYTGDITVEIKVENGEVTDITLPDYEDESDYKHYSEELVDKIKQDPLADFDTVSGATFSTGAVKDAYNEALKQAGLK